MYYVEFFFRYFHVLAGIVWIGMLYYFNFVQTEYFKEAEAGAKSDAMAKLAPRALWWFRWGAMLTFLTGAYLFHKIGALGTTMPAIWVGALAGTFMFLNVWLVIWPNQQIVLGMKEGDGPAAAAKAGLASRTNTLFSGPMLLGMLGNKYLAVPIAEGGSATGLYVALGAIVVLEINALFGGMGPMKSVMGVIHSSLALMLVILGILLYV
ncbi:urate hydroxylase PuuD [Luminiphilus sp.]|nr:urate hydroxylase PuuD [Luminiphilus sp.]MDA9711687.1 urate hydroxylase PuuD [Luminiphilus sp.]